MTKSVKESHDIGRMAQLVCFSKSNVTLRRADGGLISLLVSPYPRKKDASCGCVVTMPRHALRFLREELVGEGDPARQVR